MAVATLSAKNQIVIPREIREALQLKPGDKLTVHIYEKMLVLEKSNRTESRKKASNKVANRSRELR
jgi:AbrB family looped-hinge helix DNA binding protein